MKTELHEDYNSIETPIIGPTKSVFQNVTNMCKNAKKTFIIIYVRLFRRVSENFTYVCKITECCNVFYVYGVSEWNSNRQRHIHVHVQENTTYLLNYLINSGYLGDAGSSSKLLWTLERITDFGKCEFSIYTLGFATWSDRPLKRNVMIAYRSF